MNAPFQLNKTQLLGVLFGLIFAVSFLMHMRWMTVEIQGIHAWRQTQTAWNIRNFCRHDANIFNPRVAHFRDIDNNILRYEFPIMQWTIGMVQRIVGEHVIVIRLSMFLIGIWLAFGFYWLLRTLEFEMIPAFLGSLFFYFSPVIYYYQINPMPDLMALGGAIWYVHFILKYEKTRQRKDLILAAVFLLLATLCKLPFLMFSIISIHFFLGNIFRKTVPFLQLVRDAAIQLFIIVPALAWYAWVMPHWEGNGILAGIFANQIDHERTMFILKYHLNRMWPHELLYKAVWIPAIIGLVLWHRMKQLRWMYSLVFITFVYWILQFNMIATAHDYYMMPFLVWLFILVAIGAKFLYELPWNIGKYALVALAVMGSYQTYKTSEWKWFIQSTMLEIDVLSHREALKDLLGKDAKCVMLNDDSLHIFPYQIDKMGYVIYRDQLDPLNLRDMITMGNARFLYSTSRIVDEKPEIQAYLKQQILEAGKVRVFELKMREEIE